VPGVAIESYAPRKLILPGSAMTWDLLDQVMFDGQEDDPKPLLVDLISTGAADRVIVAVFKWGWLGSGIGELVVPGTAGPSVAQCMLEPESPPRTAGVVTGP
jgi:hypothetical protein